MRQGVSFNESSLRECSRGEWYVPEAIISGV
jgi:hypothetical protein